MKRNKKVIGVSCFVLLLLVGIMYVYVHPVNRYRLEVTRVGGSGYGYKIYERERLIIGLSLKPWGIALKFLFLHHENILFPND